MRRTSIEATVTCPCTDMAQLLSDAGSDRRPDLPVMTERVDEAAEEPTVLLVNWPNLVGPCLYCSRKRRVRVVTQASR